MPSGRHWSSQRTQEAQHTEQGTRQDDLLLHVSLSSKEGVRQGKSDLGASFTSKQQRCAKRGV